MIFIPKPINLILKSQRHTGRLTVHQKIFGHFDLIFSWTIPRVTGIILRTCTENIIVRQRNRGMLRIISATFSRPQNTDTENTIHKFSHRKNAGYAYEHTLFSSGDLLTQLMAKKGWNTETPEGTSYGFAFDENVELDGDSAGSITVTFNGDKTTTMEYDINGGVYLASQYGSPYVDGNTGAQLEFKNVIVIYTAHTFQRDSFYRRSFYDLDGSGKGYFACNGHIVPITWHRDSLRSSFYYTLEDGTPITLGVGKTYVAIVSDQKTIAYDPLPVPDDWLRNDT